MIEKGQNTEPRVIGSCTLTQQLRFVTGGIMQTLLWTLLKSLTPLNAPPKARRRTVCVCTLSRFSCVRLLVTPWTLAHQAPLSMGCYRQEYQKRLSCPPSGDLPDPGIEPASLRSLALASGFFTSSTTWGAQKDGTLRKKSTVTLHHHQHKNTSLLSRKQWSSLCPLQTHRQQSSFLSVKGDRKWELFQTVMTT